MQIVILDNEGNVFKATGVDLQPEDISLVGISLYEGVRALGNEGKIEEVLNTFREASNELSERLRGKKAEIKS